MQSFKLISALCAIYTWTLASCSLIELNDTTLATLPPLYALDEWTHCRLPGDVYCIVDAALSGDSVQLYKDYSNQTLKHYNRTLIHRGVCVTQCGTNETSGSWRVAAQECVARSVAKYGVQAEVVSVGYCMSSDSQATSGKAQALGILCVTLLGLVAVATGLHALCDHCAKIDGNKYLLAFSLKKNWTILTYDRSKPRTDDRMKDVACMEGVRFIAMQCVIFSHVIFIYIYSYIDNPQFVEKMYDQFAWQAVMNSPLWLQAFFSLSGFLTAYTVLISSDNNPLTFFKCLNSIVNRWIRITPLAAFALWFTMAWFPLLGSGPQWSWLVTREADDCSERWWYHMLYVHNHLPLGKLCMGHTWYLAVDMQLHILGIFILLLLARWQRATVPVLSLLVAVSAVAAGVVVYLYDLTPVITAQSPEALRTMFQGSKIMSLLYLPSWMNFQGYAGGIACAYILHHTQVKGVKLNQIKWFNILFHLSLHLGGIVVLSGVVFLSDSPPATWGAALYSALDRTIVSIFFNIFMLGCVSGCKSAFSTMLSWRGFHTLGRLSYCAFLIHFIVLRLTLASNTQLGHATVFSMIALFVTTSVLTYIVSIPLTLLIELPVIQLWKALTERDRHEVSPASRTASPTKSFDLVAHIRRRNDV